MSTAIAQPGDEVLIYTSELQEDPNVYILEEYKRSIAILKSKNTGCQIKVHKSRIRDILKENDGMNIENNENTAIEIEEEPITKLVDEEISEEAPKPKRKRKKIDPVKVDFTQAPFIGHEIWTKGGCNFDFDEVSVAAHCIILDDGYQTFNTYNGTLGKKGQLPEDGSLPGVFYSFNDKMNADKKRAQLDKKGYTKH